MYKKVDTVNYIQTLVYNKYHALESTIKIGILRTELKCSQ